MNDFAVTPAKPDGQTHSPIGEAQIDAALDAWEDLLPTPLVECPVCGEVGLLVRIRNHDCTRLMRQDYR